MNFAYWDFIHVRPGDKGDPRGRDAVIYHRVVLRVNPRHRRGLAEQGGLLAVRQNVRPKLVVPEVRERDERKAVQA
jgi:hypothetical protein